MDIIYNEEVTKILKDAENEMINLHHPYVGTEHLLLSLLKQNSIKDICYNYDLTYTNFKENLINIIGSASKASEVILYTPLLKTVIKNAYNTAYDNKDELDEIYLLSALFSETDGIALRIVDNMGVQTTDINKAITKQAFKTDLGINLNEKESDEKIILRESEIQEIMQVLLRKNKNNPLLIGKAGVGKTAIVEELARMIKRKEVPKKLLDKQIILINTASLIAGTKYRGEFEERVNNLLKEVISHKNIILFIDEIHNIVKTGASDGSIDAANILKPYLARSDVSIIGATTINEYNEYIKKDTALARRFAPITVNEPSNEAMSRILKKVKENYEKHYNLKIPVKSISHLIKECNLYLPNLYNPDKSIDILDTACSKKTLDYYQNKVNDLTLTSEDISEVISLRTNLYNVKNELLEEVKSKLLNNYDENTVNIVIDIIKSKKNNKHLSINSKNVKDIVMYLTSNLNIHLIDIDCASHNDEYSLNKLLSNNYLYNEISEFPFSILMFNNYNQAGRIMYNLIQGMVDNGYITSNQNEKLLLNNTVILLIDNVVESQIGFMAENKLLKSS